jgi:hypothetical protein
MPAASIRRLANLLSAILRSEGLNHWSLGSRGMLSWRCIADGSAGTGKFFTWHLLGDGRIAPEASSKTALGQQIVQLDERRYGDSRRAYLHTRARGRIQHPSRDNDDHAGRRLEMDNAARATLLAVVSADRASIKRVPAIMDLDVLSDMGRMTS